MAARVARAADCSAPEADHAGFSQRPTLLFMSGAIHDSAQWYSQRVRQELWKLHFNDSHNWTGVVFKPGQWTISQLRQSTFCLCPSGWGFGWRTVRRDRRLNHDSCRGCRPFWNLARCFPAIPRPHLYVVHDITCLTRSRAVSVHTHPRMLT